jgi:hypothetical protein
MARTDRTRSRSNGKTQRRRLLASSALIVVVSVGLASVGAAAAGDDASPAPSASAGTPFASTKLPYTIVLPAGWRALPEAREDEDLFEGPGANARVAMGPSEPGDTVEGRVAANRAEIGGEGCTSDPGEDSPTTLGGAYGIEWTWSCDRSYHAAVNAIHDGRRMRLEVSFPTGSEALAVPRLEQLRQSFAFTSAEAPPGGAEADLAAIDAQLQGTWVGAWHAPELEIATIEAAGLTAPSDWVQAIMTVTTIRYAVKFEDGSIIQYGAYDGGSLDDVGWVGTYQLLDDQTIEAMDMGTFNPIVYGFTLRDGILTMDVISDDDPVDMAIQTAIYETLPFTKEP